MEVGLIVRSSLYALGQLVSVMIFGPLSLLVFPFPFLWRFRFIRGWSRFNLWWLEVTCGLGYRVEGKENIPECNGIVFSKHQSAWETFGLQVIFPPHVWVVKRELLKIPLFGWGLAMMESIAIDRQAGRKAMREVVNQGITHLKKGRWVMIFPEGTRVPLGKKVRYKPGGAMLAARCGHPVVPVAHNAGAFWTRRSFIKRPGTIRVVIGPLIETKNRSAAEINRLAESWIEATTEELCHCPAPTLVSSDSGKSSGGICAG
jgi:1-acyl-sn-glycerol-3-phosphate acyltransferase